VPEPLPEIAALLAEAAAQPMPTDLDVPAMRAFADAGVIERHHHVRDHGPLHDIRDLTSPGGVPVRLYLPHDKQGPLHIHLHGGGWWMGSIATVDPMARELAHALDMAVLSVDYRLAPEHPWPAAPEDVYEVLTWMAESYDSISIGGESAGGNLAAVVALMARDRGGPKLVAQWLDVPAVDLGRSDDESIAAFGSGYGVEAGQLPLLLSWYGADPAHPYVSPLRGDLARLPPAIVTTAELDPLRDQGEEYAAALEAAGVPTRLIRAQGHIHASTWFTALTESAAAWHDEVVGLLAQWHALEVTA
jgi:acetyl esterase